MAQSESPKTDDEALKRALEFLNPERLRDRLVHIGFFLFAFELLRASIIDHVRMFFADGWTFTGGKAICQLGEGYAKHVRSLAANEFEACLRWLVTVDALTDQEANDIVSLINYRNVIAHEPGQIMHDMGHYQPTALGQVRAYHRKIGNFWGRIEAETNPDLMGVEVDYDGIRSGISLLLDFMALSLNEVDSQTD